MRIFDHDVDISYSTREPAQIRDNMAGLGVTTMSAESKTEPGGYYTYPQALEQFHVSDERTAVEVEHALKSLGREPSMERLMFLLTSSRQYTIDFTHIFKGMGCINDTKLLFFSN